MKPSDDKALLEQFANEHAKRARHISDEEERQAAINLLKNLSRFEWYRKQFTPTARKAHERELLAILEAYQNGLVNKVSPSLSSGPTTVDGQ